MCLALMRSHSILNYCHNNQQKGKEEIATTKRMTYQNVAFASQTQIQNVRYRAFHHHFGRGYIEFMEPFNLCRKSRTCHKHQAARTTTTTNSPTI